MSSLLDGIDIGPEKSLKKGGYRAGAEDPSQAQRKKLIIAVVILAIGVGLILWQTTAGVKPGAVLPPAPATDVAASADASKPVPNKPAAAGQPAANKQLPDNVPPPPRVGPSVGFK